MKEAIQHLRRNDPILSQIIDSVGDYDIRFRDPDLETLVKSIVYQQLSGRVASVIFGRLSQAVGGKMTPESILKLRPARMRADKLVIVSNGRAVSSIVVLESGIAPYHDLC